MTWTSGERSFPTTATSRQFWVRVVNMSENSITHSALGLGGPHVSAKPNVATAS